MRVTVLLAGALVLAGCFGPPDDPAAPPDENASDRNGSANATIGPPAPEDGGGAVEDGDRGRPNDGGDGKDPSTSDGGATGLGSDAEPQGDGEAAWPRAGSFVEYEARTSGGSPDQRFVRNVTVRLVHDGAAWSGWCNGTYEERRFGEDPEVVRSERVEERVAYAPLTAPAEARPGDAVTAGVISACAKREADVVVEERGDGRVLGEEADAESSYRDARVVWETERGLVLEFRDWGTNAGTDGRLVATDA